MARIYKKLMQTLFIINKARKIIFNNKMKHQTKRKIQIKQL